MAVIPEHVPGEQVLQGQTMEQHTDSLNHSIISFLQRPQIVGTYFWDKNWKMGTIVHNYKDWPGCIADPESKSCETTDRFDFLIPNIGMTKMVKDKLDGLTSFRATCVVRLQINSQPFQQGRLILAAIPMPTLINPRDEWLIKHPSLLQSINHVQVDISKQTEISLRVPFISPFNSYNLIDDKYPWARVVCMVYSQLKDPQNSTIPMQVWCHFEDVELGTATSGQMGLPDGNVEGIWPPPTKPAKAQGFPIPKDVTQSAVDAIRKTESKGVLGSLASDISNTASGAYDWVGNKAPVLKPITDAFSWMSKTGGNIVSKVLGVLGFSKPQTSYAGTTVLARPTQYFANANGVDHSHVLALDSLNNVDVFPGLGGTSLDEMDMNYLIRIPQFVGSFWFNRNSKYTEPLWSSYVSPSYFIPGYARFLGAFNPNKPNSYDVKELQELQPTILNYVSSFFMYWTGSLVYTFRFVKTDFHSGRVEISFHPFTNGVISDRVNYAYRAVIDLRENTEVSLTVPFVSPQPWKRVKNLDPLTKDTDAAQWKLRGPCSTGRLEVRALTPLILSSSIVNEAIQCVIEVRAGDDYRLQAPIRSTYCPMTLARSGPVAKAQAGKFALPGTSETRTSAMEGFQPPSITTSSIDTHRVDTQMLCAGEEFANFRTIIKRFAFVENLYQFPTFLSNVSRKVSDYLRPPFLSNYRLSIFADNDPTKVPFYDKIEWRYGRVHCPLTSISSMYAFYRGGLRMKVFAPDADRLMSARLLDKDDLAESLRQSNNVRRAFPYMAPTAYELTDQKGFGEFQIPFYSPVMLSVHWDYDGESEFDESASMVDLSFFSKRADDKTDIHIAIAAADDLTFHGFIGTPPVLSVQRFQVLFTPTTRPPNNPPEEASEPLVRYEGSNNSSDPCYNVTSLYDPSKESPWKRATDCDGGTTCPATVQTADNVIFNIDDGGS